MSFVSVAVGAGVGSTVGSPVTGALGGFFLRNLFGGRAMPVALGQGFNPVGMAAGGDQYGNQTANPSTAGLDLTGFSYNPWTQNYQNSQGTAFTGQSATDNDGDNIADFNFLKKGESTPAPATTTAASTFTPGPNTTAVRKGESPQPFGLAAFGASPILARTFF